MSHSRMLAPTPLPSKNLIILQVARKSCVCWRSARLNLYLISPCPQIKQAKVATVFLHVSRLTIIESLCVCVAIQIPLGIPTSSRLFIIRPSFI